MEQVKEYIIDIQRLVDTLLAGHCSAGADLNDPIKRFGAGKDVTANSMR